MSCLAGDLAPVRGLGIHVMAVMKRLDPLVASGKVNSVAIDGKSFSSAKQVPVKDEAPPA
jgi:hypothetical protein